MPQNSISTTSLAESEAGSPREPSQGAGDWLPGRDRRLPYDAFCGGMVPAAHREYVSRLQQVLEGQYPSSWAIQGYIGMQALVEAHQEAGSTDSDKVCEVALQVIDLRHAAGQADDRAKGSRQANRAPDVRQDGEDPKYPFAIMKPVSYIGSIKLMD